MPPVSVLRRFDGATGSVARARRFVVDETTDLPPEVGEAAELMVSELSTNVVLHARTAFEIRVAHADGLLRVEVRDHGEGSPTPRLPAELDPHGRGLRIVDALSTSWGVAYLPDGPGKTVWFTLDLPAPEPDPTPRHAASRTGPDVGGLAW